MDVPLFTYNVLTIMNGQSGTGKSYSMFNGDDAIAYAAAKGLFALRDQLDLGAVGAGAYRIVYTALEVYNDRLRDLLGGSTPQQIVLTRSGFGFAAKGVVENEVESIATLHHLLDQARRNREVKKTPKNPESSRGHLVCEITLIWDDPENNTPRRHKLCLVDLAGSEHASEEVPSDLRAETQFISTSRTNLQTALSNIGKAHVPAEDKVGEACLRRRTYIDGLTVEQSPERLSGFQVAHTTPRSSQSSLCGPRFHVGDIGLRR